MKRTHCCQVHIHVRHYSSYHGCYLFCQIIFGQGSTSRRLRPYLSEENCLSKTKFASKDDVKASQSDSDGETSAEHTAIQGTLDTSDNVPVEMRLSVIWTREESLRWMPSVLGLSAGATSRRKLAFTSTHRVKDRWNCGPFCSVTPCTLTPLHSSKCNACSNRTASQNHQTNLAIRRFSPPARNGGVEVHSP